MRIFKTIFPFFLLLLITSCNNAENEFSSSVCFFVFDNATHQDAVLGSAMNINSPGVFVTATKTTGSGGVLYFSFTNSLKQHSNAKADAIDLKRTSILGYNNGLIIGFGNMSDPAIFYAYDRECPNCFDPQAIPVKSKPLTVNENGIATCAVCHRQYNLNTGGNIVSGDSGSKMTRYRANTTGILGVLSVN